jgi:hypothetical protein
MGGIIRAADRNARRTRPADYDREAIADEIGRSTRGTM